MKNMPHDISPDQLLDWLKTNDIFGQFSEAVLVELLADSEWLILSEGETLFRQGDGGGFFCLVHSGSLTVTIEQKDGSVDTLSTIAPGTTVGLSATRAGSRAANTRSPARTTPSAATPRSFCHRMTAATVAASSVGMSSSSIGREKETRSKSPGRCGT